jgi:hypothetical protein
MALIDKDVCVLQTRRGKSSALSEFRYIQQTVLAAK